MCCILARPVLEDADRSGYHEALDAFLCGKSDAVNITATFINTERFVTSKSTAINLCCVCCVFVGRLEKDVTRLKVFSGVVLG